jgi:hypothetical protein
LYRLFSKRLDAEKEACSGTTIRLIVQGFQRALEATLKNAALPRESAW